MARQIIHQLVDDLDGTVLTPGQGESITFAVDGVAYEIDLSPTHADQFRQALAPYIAAGRRLRGGGSTASGATKRRRAGQVDYAPVRAWAKENGYSLADRGRVPAEVLDAYQAAQESGPAYPRQDSNLQPNA